MQIDLRDFAQRYTTAWNSQEPERVAGFFSPIGSLRVNGSTPAVGRTAIAEIARGFMSSLPDLHLTMDRSTQVAALELIPVSSFVKVAVRFGNQAIRCNFPDFETADMNAMASSTLTRVGAVTILSSSRITLNSTGRLRRVRFTTICRCIVQLLTSTRYARQKYLALKILLAALTPSPSPNARHSSRTDTARIAQPRKRAH